MRHQHHAFLEPSAVRNLERVFNGFTTHRELQGYSSRSLGGSISEPMSHRDGVSLKEVAQELGLSTEGVRQIERRAVQKCRIWCLANGYRFEDVLR